MTSLGDLWWAARHPPTDSQNLSFKDKAILVTGANSGLGHAAAIKYAALGANPLILAVRSQAKGEQAKADIIHATCCSPDIFIIEILDLTTFASVRDFVDRVSANVQRLHAVQLAAGISTPAFSRSPEGYEMALQVNVLSTALLALLLLPKLRETATASPNDGFSPHMSFVNSIAHLEVKPEWIAEDETLIQRLDNEYKFDQVSQYYLVKLAVIFVVRRLVERVGNAGVVINASCPGMCKTNMGRNHPPVQRIFMAVFYIFGRSAEQGSRTLVGATGLGPASHGKFWTNDNYLPPSEFMDSERGNALYRETWEGILSILRGRVGLGAI
ncbi:Retinol dehydrogenase 14 [Madurella mycetomatis]|uniref:Retinol dehydrogenase 14 n=1 Tax=Madurella mycetomatis TaxID=100816 RepID=A0A175WET9_9PEZI|nr:Retinol dehydrogenase 14 [Madurella mycetomatis]